MYDNIGLTPVQINLIKQIAEQIRLAKHYNDKVCFVPVQGEAAAGEPLFAPSDEDNVVPVPEKYLDSRFFVVAARGKSMEPRIMDGDYVVVQKDAPGEIGGIVLARIDGLAEDEYMIKRFFPRGKTVEFRSFNESFQPIVYPVSKVLSVEKVVYIIHR